MRSDPGAAFAEFEQLLVSNSGEDAFVVALRLLAGKLVDEMAVRGGAPPRFVRDEDPESAHRRIVALHNQAIDSFPEIDALRGPLGITPDVLVRCLPPLLGWSILDSDLAHLDAALEHLVAPDAKGALGQYFTPREVVRLCVRALDPRPDDDVIDPACGSGGFLFEAVRHSIARHGAPPRCLGIDLGARSLAVAQLLAHASTRGAIRVRRGNALDPRGFDAEAIGAAFDALRCSLLFANPPFAGDVDDPSLLASYEAHREAKRGKRMAASREHLFVERAVQLLRPGGRLAIVVPQGLLANPSAAYLRRFLRARCRVLAVVGLHPYAFLPHTGVKTSILFLERSSNAPSTDYPVFFAVSSAPGKDGSGRTVGGDDYDAIAMTLATFVAKPKPGPSTVPFAELAEHDRLDAEYWQGPSRGLEQRLAAQTKVRVADVVSRSIERFRRDGEGPIEYVDISSVDARTGVATPITMSPEEAPSRATWIVKRGDVLVSMVRPDRNVVALVDVEAKRRLVASSGFCVLRPERVAPEVLYAFCKTRSFRALLGRHATATMYPAVTDRDVLDLPFVDPGPQVSRSIVDKVRAAFERIHAARAGVQEGIDLMQKALDP
jgi:SAM-dependent methyltransferase